jgi:ornithine carbamoyltransferase
MKSYMKGRSLLTLKDLSQEELRYLLHLSCRLKKEKKKGNRGNRLSRKTLAMIFEKRSTRTRSAFATAIAEEGGVPDFLSLQDIQLGMKETLEDTARVLGKMYDAILFRGFRQDTAETLAETCGIPVYNGLTDLFHPTQILADLMTMEEAMGNLSGRTLAYLGDCRNNVANSLLIGCAKMGLNSVFVAPNELAPRIDIIEYGQALAEKSGARIHVTSDVKDGVSGVDVVYTDVWTSMGEEEKTEGRVALLRPYQVDGKIMGMAVETAIFLHCLPAVRGNEVTAEVLDGNKSRVWDQVENRKYTAKAVMLATL